MSKNERMTSLKVKFIYIFCAILIPQTIFLLIYSSNMMNEINERISQSQKSTLSLLTNEFEAQILSAENFLASVAINNNVFRQLGLTADIEKSYYYTYELFKNNENLFTDNMDIAAMAIFNKKNDILYTNYGLMPSYSVDERVKVKYSVDKTINTLMRQKQIIENQWFLLDADGKKYYCRIVSSNDAYFLCLFDFKHMSIRASDSGGRLIFADEDIVLNHQKWLVEQEINLENMEEYYITQNSERQLVVQEQRHGVTLYYMTGYNGTLQNVNLKQIQLFLISLLSFIIFPIVYLYISKRILKPMNHLVATMKKIRDGDLETTTDWKFRTSEFYLVHDTFNEMISQVKNLKIESYEKQIEKERANLQALRLQIRHHFFLNCLKILYGLAETKRYKNIQEYIVLLSKYLRYIFQDNSNLVTIEKELTSCQNYISLQKFNLNDPPKYTVDIDARVMHINIPPITLLTLIENCVKHGTQIGKTLEITVNIGLLASEDGELVNITIHDNGPGFGEEMLRKLNNLTENTVKNDRVGLINIIRRFQLIYGEQFGIAFSNKKGAVIDIFFSVQNRIMNEGDDA